MQGISQQDELMRGNSARSGRFDNESNYLSDSYETPTHSGETPSPSWDTVWGSVSGLKNGWQRQQERDSETEPQPPQEVETQPESSVTDPVGDSETEPQPPQEVETQPESSVTDPVGDSETEPQPPQEVETQPDSTVTDPVGDFASLTQSTDAITTTHDGQIIENLDLHVASGDAITVQHDNVIIRNVRIFHADGDGIRIAGANNVTIEYSEVIHSAPPSGMDPFLNSHQHNIISYDAPGLTINEVIVRDGSSGIYLVESPGAEISNVEGYNFHGPMPRGQFVQFDKSGDSSLTNFYALNDAAFSHPEDIISVYHSPNVVISNGLIDGNNSQSGVAVMFEGESQGGRVSNVDAINQGNGAFSSYSDNVEFLDTRSFDNIDGDQGRGDSLSNALIWNISGDGISIFDSSYTNPGNPDNIAWDLSRAVTAEIYEDPNALPMDSVSVELPWA